MYLSAALNGIALLIAIFVQTMNTPLAGAWLLFHIAGCCCSYKSEEQKTTLWWASLAWLITIGFCAFILKPIVNGASTMWILASAPMLAVSVRKDHIEKYVDFFLAITLLFAFGLIIQTIIGVRYTAVEYHMDTRKFMQMSWPMLDPNNAAAIINPGLIVCFFMAIKSRTEYMYIKRKNRKWWIPFIILATALYLTASKAGLLAAIIACSILFSWQFGLTTLLLMALPVSFFLPKVGPCLKSFNDRIPIWVSSLHLMVIHPLTGLGLGSFGYYYQQIRKENYTGGWFAHNDILQFSVEMGIPAAAVFCLLMVLIAKSTSQKNIASGCVILAMFLQSMVEFQFYVPAFSIIFGLALACHIRLSKQAI